MLTTRRIRIVLTSRRTTSTTTVRNCCPFCGRQTVFLTHDQAAEILQKDRAGIDGLIRSGKIHAIPAAQGGELRICSDSVLGRLPA